MFQKATQAIEATNPGQVVVLTRTNRKDQSKWQEVGRWNNQDGLRPASIQVQLYKDGPLRRIKWWASIGEWLEGAFETLMPGRWKSHPYTVKRSRWPRGLQVTVNDRTRPAVVLTNTHEPALTEMKVTKDGKMQ